jgi:hypothetical protein
LLGRSVSSALVSPNNFFDILSHQLLKDSLLLAALKDPRGNHSELARAIIEDIGMERIVGEP